VKCSLASRCHHLLKTLHEMSGNQPCHPTTTTLHHEEPVMPQRAVVLDRPLAPTDRAVVVRYQEPAGLQSLSNRGTTWGVSPLTGEPCTFR
jgi:hypothetical protein